MPTPLQLDFSKAKPINQGGGVTLDFSKAQPIASQGGSAPSSTPPDPSGRTPTGEPASGDNRNGFKRTLDNLITPDQRREEWQGPVRNAADSFSRGVAENVLPFVSHPLKSGLGVLKSLGGAIANSGGTAEGFGRELAKPMIESAMQDYQDRGTALAIPHMVGQGTGAWATGELGGATAKPVLSSIASKVAPALERGGLNLGNTALGARGVKPFQYGANPARGAFEEGVLPAMSKHSAAMKTEAALPRVGEQISGPIENSQATIPRAQLETSITHPIASRMNSMRGPGGFGSEEPLMSLADSMERTAPNASRPISGFQASPKSTPSDVWHTIRNIDENTRFNPNPEIEDLNSVRRDIRHGLRGNLESAVPEIKAPSQTYSDLKGAGDALDRTMHSGTSLGKMASVPMFPIESAVGKGLYTAGRNLPALGQAAGEGARYLSPAAALIQELQKKKGVNQ